MIEFPSSVPKEAYGTPSATPLADAFGNAMQSPRGTVKTARPHRGLPSTAKEHVEHVGKSQKSSVDALAKFCAAIELHNPVRL